MSVCLSCLSVTLVYCDQTVGWIRMPLGVEVGLVPRHIVLDGDLAPSPPKRRRNPQFSAPVCCDQMAGWIKMPLGTEVGLCPGNLVLDGDQSAPAERGTAAPTFRSMSIVVKRSPISATAEQWLKVRRQVRRHRGRKYPQWGPGTKPWREVWAAQFNGLACHFVNGVYRLPRHYTVCEPRRPAYHSDQCTKYNGH